MNNLLGNLFGGDYSRSGHVPDILADVPARTTFIDMQTEFLTLKNNQSKIGIIV